MRGKLKDFYSRRHKFLLIVPIIIMLLSLGVIGLQYFKTGEFVNKDVSLKGGITATISTKEKVDIQDLESFVSSRLGTDVFVRELTDFITREQVGIIIETGNVDSDELKSVLKEKVDFNEDSYSVEEVGPSLGEAFFRQLLWAVVFAFLFMAAVVFITFRTFIPSLAVIQAALTDMIFTLAVINLLGIKLSTTGVAALLLMIGYSVDTDILLTTRILKRRGEGSVMDRIFDSMKTGLTMTGTTLVAVGIAFFISNSYVLKQMFLILIIGLIYDVISTYLANAIILKMYCDKKGIT